MDFNARPVSFHLTAAAISVALSYGVNASPIVSALEDGQLGMHGSKGLKITNGLCLDCSTSSQALWYFQDEIIAAPHVGIPTAGFSKTDAAQKDVVTFLADSTNLNVQSPLIWLGSPSVIPRTHLSADGKLIQLPNGQALSFAVTPQIATNLSYYNDTSRTYLTNRPLRMRGELHGLNGNKQFVARTIWPLDFAITPDTSLQPLKPEESLKGLVKSNNGGANQPFNQRLLWEKNPGTPRKWDNKAVIGIMLNGAQGDDDEAHGGHFAIATGRYRNDGDWSRWMVYNFYNLASVSEKGIIAAPTPMDKYMLDLNNGQSWYRPSYMIVAVLKNDTAALQYQAAIERVYNHFYRHDFDYHHADANCTGISMQTLKSLGWQPPLRGHDPWVKAIGAYLYVAATSGDLKSARKIYDSLLAESTHLYPASGFDELGEDLLDIVERKSLRSLTKYEQVLADDVEAIYYVHVPQIPSSRAPGLAPVYSFDEYMKQAPANQDDWKIIPTDDRTFPDELRDGLALKAQPARHVPLPVIATVVVIISILTGLTMIIRRLISRRRQPTI